MLEITINVDSWAIIGPQAAAIRQQVFVIEQGIDATEEWDEQDALSRHAIALIQLPSQAWAAVGTARLLPSEKTAHGTTLSKIGRMAVLPAYRKQGIGAQLLQTLIAEARARQDDEIWLHAQRHACHFYAAQGFTEIGPPFIEAGIPHVNMQLLLK
ncbi:GNAT family N-acetyltransferase [Parvibium lacunae]|uniref:GNAT family N-acetyltransferase n=1 Tax=Parvibium lacunae TaxID=1888893 RepID=A0A368L7P1_9BURK|nr:GNAT family N-acetyltransferase [Parvibium lacunae]RCS59636.1 GNAT family N-acetyltransferase [Parvibium lacunae]